jgi:hypothetical protein
MLWRGIRVMRLIGGRMGGVVEGLWSGCVGGTCLMCAEMEKELLELYILTLGDSLCKLSYTGRVEYCCRSLTHHFTDAVKRVMLHKRVGLAASPIVVLESLV